MPAAIRSLCRCGGIKTDGTCDRCGAKPAVKERKTRHERGYGRDWVKVTNLNRQLVPVCVLCWHKGITTIPTIADPLASHHIEKIRDAPEKRLDLSNVVSVCKECHVALDTLYETDRASYRAVAAELVNIRDSLLPS